MTATLSYTAAGAAASTTSPAYYRYDGPWVGGEKEKVVNIVPVAVGEAHAGHRRRAGRRRAGSAREFRVTVANNAKTGARRRGAARDPAGLDGAAGVRDAHLRRRGRRSHVAVLRDAAGEAAAGRHRDQGRRRRATASRTARATRSSPTTTSRSATSSTRPARTVKIFDVTLPRNLQIGYVMGTGDEVPQAIRQLGANLTMLDADDVAFGDLSRFSTIVLGIRAYEKRADVRAYNQRLLDFARNGGHLVVQYNKVAMNQLGAGAAGGGRGFGGDVPAAGPPGGRGAGGPGGPPPGAAGGRTSRRGWPGPRRPRRRRAAGQPIRALPGRHYEQSRVRRGGAGSRARRGRRRADRSRIALRPQTSGLGPGARPLLLRRERRALHGSARLHRHLAQQPRREARHC